MSEPTLVERLYSCGDALCETAAVRIVELENQLEGAEQRGALLLEVMDDRDKAAARIAELEAQLPDGMKHCTIVFKECPTGHGRLTATNWIDHGCPRCREIELEAERDRLKFALEVIRAGETSSPATMADAALSLKDEKA